MLDLLGLFCVEARSSQGIVQVADQETDVILQTGALRAWPMKKVENLQIEKQAVALHDDIV